MINTVRPHTRNLYITTAEDKNGNYAQISVKRDDFTNLVQNTWGLNTLPATNHIGGQPVSCALMADYMKALNGILPDGVKYDLKYPTSPLEYENTEFRILGNNDGSRMIINKVCGDDVEEVLSVFDEPIQ